MSAVRRMQITEIDAIKQAFTKRDMPLPFNDSTLQQGLFVPEDKPASECIAALPRPGTGLIMDPFAAERKQLRDLINAQG